MERIRPRVQLFCKDISLAKESFKKQADINHIVKKYLVNSPETWEYLQKASKTYADLSHVTDYRTALDKVREAKEHFMMLPPKVRLKFANDPAQFLDFIKDPKNKAEMVELGLIEKEQPKKEEIPSTEQKA